MQSQKTKAAGLHTQTAHTKQLLNPNDTSSQNQRAIVLSALREDAQTTISLRHHFGVMHPAARVQELRDRGYRIDAVRVASITPDGVRHHAVARYVLATSSDFSGEVMP